MFTSMKGGGGGGRGVFSHAEGGGGIKSFGVVSAEV